MTEWENDKKLFELINWELFSCVIGDVMDQLDYRHQYLPARIRPLFDGVVAVPRAVEQEVMELALQKVHDENMVAIKIREGMPTREVWDSYGIMQK